MKKCPMCAEEIQDEAKICKHCGASMSDAEKSLEISNFIEFFQSKTGNIYSLKSRDDKNGKIIMEKEGSAFSAGVCFLLFLFFVIPGFIYLLSNHGKKYSITILFDSNGKIEKIMGNNFTDLIIEYNGKTL